MLRLLGDQWLRRWRAFVVCDAAMSAKDNARSPFVSCSHLESRCLSSQQCTTGRAPDTHRTAVRPASKPFAVWRRSSRSLQCLHARPALAAMRHPMCPIHNVVRSSSSNSARRHLPGGYRKPMGSDCAGDCGLGAASGVLWDSVRLLHACSQQSASAVTIVSIEYLSAIRRVW